MSVEELQSRRNAPGVTALAQRIDALSITIHGTSDDPAVGLVARVKAQEAFNAAFMRRLNLWGGILLGAFAMSGVANGSAATAVHAVIKAFAVGAGG